MQEIKIPITNIRIGIMKAIIEAGAIIMAITITTATRTDQGTTITIDQKMIINLPDVYSP